MNDRKERAELVSLIIATLVTLPLLSVLGIIPYMDSGQTEISLRVRNGHSSANYTP